MQLKEIINNTNLRSILSNFISLSFLQIANFILPLLTIPYLVRTLGMENYGMLAFATSIIMYFQVVSEYGFNLTATREVSVYRDNKEKLEEIYSAVTSSKIILGIISFIMLTISMFFIERFAEEYLIIYLTFGIVIGQIFFPIWFFQGIEKMQFITFLNVLSKIVFTALIFLLIKNPEHMIYVPVFQSLGYLIAGVISVLLVLKRFDIQFKIPSFKIILKYLKDGFQVFISRIAVMGYTSGNIMVLGLFLTNENVGYYSISEKVVAAGTLLGSIVGQVLFPYFSKVWHKDRSLYYLRFKQTFVMISIIMVLIALVIWFFSDMIVLLISGELHQKSVDVLKILSISVILIPLGGLFTQNLVVQKQDKYVTKITAITFILNFLIVIYMVKSFQEIGLAYTVVIIQCLQIFINTVIFFRIKNRNICVV